MEKRRRKNVIRKYFVEKEKEIISKILWFEDTIIYKSISIFMYAQLAFSEHPVYISALFTATHCKANRFHTSTS